MRKHHLQCIKRGCVLKLYLGIERIFGCVHVADHCSNVADNCCKEENSAKHVQADVEVPGGKVQNITTANVIVGSCAHCPLLFSFLTHSISLTGWAVSAIVVSVCEEVYKHIWLKLFAPVHFYFLHFHPHLCGPVKAIHILGSQIWSALQRNLNCFEKIFTCRTSIYDLWEEYC